MTSFFKEAVPIHIEGVIFFFCGHSGEGWVSTKECLAVFGDDIKIGGREMEAGDCKIMGNGRI